MAGLLLLAVASSAFAQRPPAPAQPQPLPNLDALMHDVEANQRRSEALAENYTYRVRTLTEKLDKMGRVTSASSVVAQSVTIDGVRVQRVLARNGKPLTPAEAQKENQQIDKEVAHARQQRASDERKGEQTNAEGEQVLTLSRILELGTFSNLRAGTFAGRPAWLVDYRGNPNAKTRSEFEKVFRDITGTIWIDQQDRQLEAGRGTLLKDFKIGFGLLINLKKNLTFGFTFTRVAPQTWLLASVNAQGQFRFLIFGGGNVRLEQTTSDYQKFRVTTTIIPSDRLIGPDGKPVMTTPQKK